MLIRSLSNTVPNIVSIIEVRRFHIAFDSRHCRHCGWRLGDIERAVCVFSVCSALLNWRLLLRNDLLLKHRVEFLVISHVVDSRFVRKHSWRSSCCTQALPFSSRWTIWIPRPYNSISSDGWNSLLDTVRTETVGSWQTTDTDRPSPTSIQTVRKGHTMTIDDHGQKDPRISLGYDVLY